MSSPFTHIIIGSGSAGSILASNLTSNPHFNVLLLEAGPDSKGLEGPQNARRVPMKGQSETFNPEIDWNVRVELPGVDQGMHVPQAKLLGGGSSINGGTALRNSPRDCEEWVDLGNPEWGRESVEKVYEDLESSSGHPMVRMEIEEAGRIQKAFVAGSIEGGLPWVEDLNATGAEGTGASPVCRKGETRISAANTFIDPIRGKSNFHLWTNTLVDRILFSQGCNPKAIGVLLADSRSILATSEILLAAGAVFSPAILQRSGIGPAALLHSLQIPLIHSNLSVGNHLSDHPCVPVVARPKPNAYNPTDFSLQMQARWSSTPNSGTLDLQMVCFSYLYAQPSPHPSQEEAIASTRPQRSLGGTASGHVAGIGCNLNKPTSLGTLTLQSRSPYTQPLIAPNYLTTTPDLAALRQCVRRAHKILLSDAMQEVLSPPLGLTQEIVASDESLDAWIQGQYSSTYHFTSTCRMASPEEGGVVDQSGRVYGVSNLRVADASVIPTIPAANTMWTTMMFAERIGRSVGDGKDVGVS